MPNRQPHILCFNPYARWSLHSARQTAILHGLRLRGSSTTYVLCDGLMPECDMFQPAKGPGYVRNKMSCSLCQAGSAATLNKFGHTFYWLSRWLLPTIEDEARAWADSTQTNELTSARTNSWSIGEWVRSSVHSHFRTEVLNTEDSDVAEVYRRYLTAGYIVAYGVDALMEAEQPDVLLLFNGRMAPTRVALEIAKRRNIRVITEERGFTPGHMRLVENTHCLDPNPFYALWQDWKNTPLNKSECKQIAELLSAHRKGKGFELPLFAAPTAGSDTVLEELDLDRGRPLLSVFTSATDESACQTEARGAFTDQQDWLHRTVKVARTMQDVQFVLRAHPNTDGKRALGTNNSDAALISHLARSAPGNVRVVQPDSDISSFDLIAASDGGMVWHSSLGLEMAAMGKPVLRGGAYWFRDADFMYTLASEDALQNTIQRLLTPDSSEDRLNRTIQAWRFAACWFFRQSIPFDLVRQPDWASGEFNFNSAQPLKPGENHPLDHVCTILMDGHPVFTKPDSRSNGVAAEERTSISEHIERFAKQ